VAVDDFLIITETMATIDSCPVRPPEADISATTTTPTTSTAAGGDDLTGCDFSVDLCGWLADENEFFWTRANAAEFAGTGIESPSGDFEHNPEG
jgi:hypothetical protein